MATLPLRMRVNRLLGAQPNPMEPVFRMTGTELARAVPFLAVVSSYSSENPGLARLLGLAKEAAKLGESRTIRVALNNLGLLQRYVPDQTLRDGLTTFLGDRPGFGHALAQLTSLLMVQVSDQIPPIVSFGSYTDGIAGAVQGGVVGYAGMMALDAVAPPNIRGPSGPFALDIRMRRPLVPGNSYEVGFGASLVTYKYDVWFGEPGHVCETAEESLASASWSLLPAAEV